MVRVGSREAIFFLADLPTPGQAVCCYLQWRQGRLPEHRIAGAPVVDDEGNLLGMLSEFDCMQVALNAGYHGTWGGPVRDYMSDGVETVDADMSIVDLAQVFINKKFRRFPVVQGTRLVGQISRRDVLRALENIAKG